MPDARDRSAWEYPRCPECDTDVFVGRSNSSVYGYVCHFCGALFRSAYPASKHGRAA